MLRQNKENIALLTPRTREKARQNTLRHPYGHNLQLQASFRESCEHTYARKHVHNYQIEGLTGRTYACKLGRKAHLVGANMSIKEVTSTIQMNLQSSTYGRKLDRNIKIEDLTSRAYSCKIPSRHATHHFHLFTTLFLSS